MNKNAGEIMEYLDIVTWGDKVVGKATKEEIYQKLRPHRIVYVLIFNDKGKLALQKRSKNSSLCPNYWSTVVGGHVQSGETYEQAAMREYQKEFGAQSNLEFFSKDFYSDWRRLNKFVVAFSTVNNGPFKANPDKVQSVKFFSINEIERMIKKGEKFHPELLFLLRKYFDLS
jgi:isopentenyldiphosphate isomerase